MKIKKSRFKEGSEFFEYGARIEKETDTEIVIFLPTDSRVGMRTNDGDKRTFQDSHTRGGHVSVFKNGVLDFVVRKTSRFGGLNRPPKEIYDSGGNVLGNIEYLGKSTEE